VKEPKSPPNSKPIGYISKKTPSKVPSTDYHKDTHKINCPTASPTKTQQ